MKLKNPNYVSVDFDGLHYFLEFDGQEVVNGFSQQAFTMAAHGETEFELELEVDYLNLGFRGIKGVLQKELKYRYTVLLFPDFPVLGKREVIKHKEGSLSFTALTL